MSKAWKPRPNMDPGEYENFLENPNQYIQTNSKGEQFIDIRNYKRSDEDTIY